jgi:transglutaminase-like putative cysteine protease
MNKKILAFLMIIFGFLGYICIHFPLHASDSEENATLFIDEELPAWDKKYKDVPVIRLLYDRYIEINEDFSYTEEVHSVLKIQSEKGKEVGNIPVQYNSETDIIEHIEAYTITPEGTRIKCTQITDRSAYEGLRAISENRVKLFTMPQVIAGSMLEFKFRIFHKKPVIEDNFFTYSSITSTMPVKVTRIKIVTPDNMELSYKNQNTDIKPKKEHNGNKVIYLWETKGKETELVEKYMPNISEVCQRVYISSIKTWVQLADLCWDLFNKNIVVSEDIKEKVKEVTAEDETPREKIQSIIKFIQNECRYVTMSVDSHHYEPHPSDEVFANKYGDCKDQTVLALAMLKEIGINAYPALFAKTYDPDFWNRLPMPSFFNHVILCIEYESAKYFTDVLTRGFYFDEIPYGLAGAYVLVLNGNGGSLERVPESNPASYMRAMDFGVDINEDGSAIFDGSITFPRRASIMIRRSYLNNSPANREKFLSTLDASLSNGGSMLNRKINNIDDPYMNIKMDIKYKRLDFVQIANDMMIFGIGKMNPPNLPAGERIHPIIFTLSVYENKNNFKIPGGFEVLNLPKDIHYNTEYASFDRAYQQDNGTIKVMETFRLKLAWLPPDVYSEVMEFFGNIRKATNDRIVIKKKGT